MFVGLVFPSVLGVVWSSELGMGVLSLSSSSLGGLATVIISTPPVYEAWEVGGLRVIFALFFGFFNYFLYP